MKRNSEDVLNKSKSWKNVAEIRGRAKRALPPVLFDYVDGAAGDEITLKGNLAAFGEVDLLSRAASFPPETSTATKLFGTSISMPLVLSPCGGVRLLWPDGDRAVARAANAAEIPYTMSTASRTSPEELFDSTPGPLWFQLYFHGEKQQAEQLLDRVQAKGFSALFVTVDSGGFSNLERIHRHRDYFPMTKSLQHAVHFAPQFVSRPKWSLGFARDGMPTTYSTIPETAASKDPLREGASEVEKSSHHPCPDWDDIDWIRRRWTGPLVVKGILAPNDARRAADCGANGIVISNHGGRQLDGVPATLRTLRSIKKEIGSELTVLLDGGVRRGTDVIKALALGADAAMIGRPYLYGLAAGGQSGVARVLEIFRTDIERALGQLGLHDVAEIDESIIDASRLQETTFP